MVRDEFSVMSAPRLILICALALTFEPAAPAGQRVATGGSVAATASADWPTFGGDNSRSNANLAPTRITPANVGRMVRQRVTISSPIDAGLIYLRGVQVGAALRDVFFGTTVLGHTVAIDAANGTVLWEFAPPGFDEAAAIAPTDPANRLGVRQLSASTPVADADRRFIYAPSPDGKVTKLSVADGTAVWSTAVTSRPLLEKFDAPLSFVQGRVIAVTASYRDQRPYQGHIVTLDAATGAIQHVWNALCSDRHELMDPATCPQAGAAIWPRAGIVMEPATGNLLFATGNGPWDGNTAWGDALIMLAPDASRMLGNWTPTNNAELFSKDLDLGSTSPVLLGDGYLAQGGKDGTIRVIHMDGIRGADPHHGNEVQVVTTLGPVQLLSALAVASIDGTTWLFASQYGERGEGGTVAWTFGADHLLKEAWKIPTGGFTPFYAGGLLFVYDVEAGGVMILDAASGATVGRLQSGGGHWNSVIVADDRIALPEGAVNWYGGRGGGSLAPSSPPSAGIVNIWRLP